MKTIVFDTDCFSTILYAGAMGPLMLTIGNGHVLPEEVVGELMEVNSYKQQVSSMLRSKMIIKESLPATAKEVQLYSEIQSGLKSGIAAGKGETEALILAYKKDGIIASNNTKDIDFYVRHFGIEQVRTKDLLMACVDNKKISMIEAESFWYKRRPETRLPNCTLEELINREGYRRINCS